MQVTEQRRLAHEILRSLDATGGGTSGSATGDTGLGTGLAPEVLHNDVLRYTSTDWVDDELATIFRTAPQLVGLSGQLPEPGDVITDDLAGVPVVVVRGNDGVARAFVNTCRHRGAPVEVERCASRRTLMCPYHGWTYGLSGELLAISDREAFPGLDLESRALVPLDTREEAGLIFVTPSPTEASPAEPSAADPSAWSGAGLATLLDELASYDLGSYVPWRSTTMVKDFNWKLAIETFHETYHFAWLHSKTVAPLFIPNFCHFTAFGPHHRVTMPRRSIVQLREQDEDAWDVLPHIVNVYQLFPNAILVWLVDHLELWQMHPVDGRPDRCRIRLTLLTPEPSTTPQSEEHWEKSWKLTIDTVEAEDFVMAEGIQRGMATGAQQQVAYGRNEPAMQHFAASVGHAVER